MTNLATAVTAVINETNVPNLSNKEIKKLRKELKLYVDNIGECILSILESENATSTDFNEFMGALKFNYRKAHKIYNILCKTTWDQDPYRVRINKRSISSDTVAWLLDCTTVDEFIEEFYNQPMRYIYS